MLTAETSGIGFKSLNCVVRHSQIFIFLKTTPKPPPNGENFTPHTQWTCLNLWNPRACQSTQIASERDLPMAPNSHKSFTSETPLLTFRTKIRCRPWTSSNVIPRLCVLKCHHETQFRKHAIGER
jgi:hypothetical protein